MLLQQRRDHFSRPSTQLRLARSHARTKRNNFPVGRLRSTSISTPRPLSPLPLTPLLLSPLSPPLSPSPPLLPPPPPTTTTTTTTHHHHHHHPLRLRLGTTLSASAISAASYGLKGGSHRGKGLHRTFAVRRPTEPARAAYQVRWRDRSGCFDIWSVTRPLLSGGWRTLLLVLELVQSGWSSHSRAGWRRGAPRVGSSEGKGGGWRGRLLRIVQLIVDVPVPYIMEEIVVVVHAVGVFLPATEHGPNRGGDFAEDRIALFFFHCNRSTRKSRKLFSLRFVSACRTSR